MKLAVAITAVAAAFVAAPAVSAVAPAPQRVPLAEGMPAFAPGYTLALTRVVIPAGAALAPHRHPGMQAAYVVSGTLRYTVYRGTVTVYRGAADGTQRVVRRIGPGQTGSSAAGEWIAETPNVWHAGGSGGRRVVIYLASLLKSGAPWALSVKP